MKSEEQILTFRSHFEYCDAFVTIFVASVKLCTDSDSVLYVLTRKWSAFRSMRLSFCLLIFVQILGGLSQTNASFFSTSQVCCRFLYLNTVISVIRVNYLFSFFFTLNAVFHSFFHSLFFTTPQQRGNVPKLGVNCVFKMYHRWMCI